MGCAQVSPSAPTAREGPPSMKHGPASRNETTDVPSPHAIPTAKRPSSQVSKEACIARRLKQTPLESSDRTITPAKVPANESGGHIRSAKALIDDPHTHRNPVIVHPSRAPAAGHQLVQSITKQPQSNTDVPPSRGVAKAVAKQGNNDVESLAHDVLLELHKAQQDMKHQKKAHDELCASLQQSNAKKDAQIKQLGAEIQKKKEEAQTREAELTAQYAKIDRLEGFVRKFQERVGRQIEPAQWKPDSPTDTTRRLDVTHQEIRSWAQRYIVQRPICVTDLDLLNTVLCSAGTPGQLDLLDISTDGYSVSGTKASMAVQAVLASVASHCIVANAFFVFYNDPEPDADSIFRGHNAMSLTQMHRVLRHFDVTAENAWRRQLLRSLEPVSIGDSQTTAPMKQMTTSSRSRAACRLASRCVQALTPFLASSRVSVSAAFEELASIFVKSAESASRMWLQHSCIQAYGFKHMASSSCLRYQADVPQSDWLSLHPQHERLVDDDAAVLNGFPVRLLITPAVVSFGNADGTRPEERTVLRKAVVWLGDQDVIRRVDAT